MPQEVFTAEQLAAKTRAVDEIMADVSAPIGVVKREIAQAVFTVAASASEFETAKLVKMARELLARAPAIKPGPRAV
jgi:hypothetical protein